MFRTSFQVIAIIFIALALFVVWDFSQRAMTNARIIQTEQDLEGQVAKAQATHAWLVQQKTRVATNEYVEEFARSKWRWIRDGETLVVAQVTPIAAPQPNAPQSTPVPAKNDFWQSVFDFLFGP